MAWFGGRLRRRSRAPKAGPIDLERQVEEALLIVASDLRMRAKNQLILAALTSEQPYDAEALVEGMRGEIAELIAEKRASVARLSTQELRAARRRGVAVHQSDYRSGDVVPIRARRRTEERLAEKLQGMLDDDTVARTLLAAARDAALEEIFHARLLTTDDRFHDDDYEGRNREERLALLALDLAALEEERE